METIPYDLAILGGGIVGLASAEAIRTRAPRSRIVVLEKEPRVAMHQSGRNSGVIHSGIYYRPGSLKARLCVEGVRRLREFCAAEGVPVADLGKVIVAVNEAEVPRLEALYERGIANGVPGLERIGPERLREIEPHARGVGGLHSPRTAVVDFSKVAEALARRLAGGGAEVLTGARVSAIRRAGGEWILGTSRGPVSARGLVSCAGLHADRIARMAGSDPGCRIVPFRGEYYRLRPDRRQLVRGLIYPVPDPEFPFLGVHFTRTVEGEVEAGPNAVLAFAREGYRISTIDPVELGATFGYRGFRILARRHWRMGFREMLRSVSRRAFTRALRRLVPELAPADLVPGGSGVRAQALEPDGTLVDDFRILTAAGALHVLNAPSPAATASLAIGEHIAQLAVSHLSLR